MPVVNIDANLENADWTKQSWDIPAHSVKDLRAWQKRQGMTIAHFKRLPVYRFNVEKLAWLKDL